MLLNENFFLKFNEEFIKNYDEDSDKRNILEVDVEYPKNSNDLHSDLPFLLQKMKIKLIVLKNLFIILITKINYVVLIKY